MPRAQLNVLSTTAGYRIGMSNCTIEGCARPHYARGWCNTHYKRWWKRGGHPLDRQSGKLGWIGPHVPHALRSPRTTDLYWAAGFLEGEGCFSHGSDGTESVLASQVQREPLERLVAFFGGTIKLRPQYDSDLEGAIQAGIHSRQPLHTWRVTGGRARGVMLTLFALLSPKRKTEVLKALAAKYRRKTG